MPLVYLALGTNIGERDDNLKTALSMITQKMDMKFVSPVYQSDPMYELDQPAFLNMVCGVETDLPPVDVLAFVKHIETEIGRRPTYRNGPRVIDVDVIFYGDTLVELSEPDLTIPHMRYAERGFVLQPMVDISPDYKCPKTGETMVEKLSKLKSQLGTDGLGIYPYLDVL